MAKREGYLIVDHSASPGLPDDIARRVGYDPAQTREGKVYETKTLTCAHCKCTIVPNPARTRARENCPKCSHRYICDGCAYEMTLPDYKHMPFEAKLDALPSRPPEPLGTPSKLILP